MALGPRIIAAPPRAMNELIKCEIPCILVEYLKSIKYRRDLDGLVARTRHRVLHLMNPRDIPKDDLVRRLVDLVALEPRPGHDQGLEQRKIAEIHDLVINVLEFVRGFTLVRVLAGCGPKARGVAARILEIPGSRESCEDGAGDEELVLELMLESLVTRGEYALAESVLERSPDLFPAIVEFLMVTRVAPEALAAHLEFLVKSPAAKSVPRNAVGHLVRRMLELRSPAFAQFFLRTGLVAPGGDRDYFDILREIDSKRTTCLDFHLFVLENLPALNWDLEILSRSPDLSAPGVFEKSRKITNLLFDRDGHCNDHRKYLGIHRIYPVTWDRLGIARASLRVFQGFVNNCGDRHHPGYLREFLGVMAEEIRNGGYCHKDPFFWLLFWSVTRKAQERPALPGELTRMVVESLVGA